jgi:hypothetical protein
MQGIHSTFFLFLPFFFYLKLDTLHAKELKLHKKSS